jgi:plastocyanin
MVSPARACAAALLGLALLAACGGASKPAGPTPTPARPIDGVLTVHASEWRFEPSHIALRQGEEVRIEFLNDGEILHDLKIEDLVAEGIASQSSGPLSGDEGELFVGAEQGDGGSLTFTPAETGAFTYYCTIPQHRQLGMKGTLLVE